MGIGRLRRLNNLRSSTYPDHENRLNLWEHLYLIWIIEMSDDQSVHAAATVRDLRPKDLHELLGLQDRNFVEAAYQVLLGRNADTAGRDYYLSRIRSGARKLPILKEMSASIEARAKGIELKGLRNALRWQTIRSIPVLGNIVGVLFGIEGDSAAAVRSRIIANQPHALSQTLEEFRQRQSLFETQQLPTLLQTISDINQRQLASDSVQDNLSRSVPVALRQITRDLTRMESSSRSTDRRLEDLRERYDSTLNSLHETVTALSTLSEQRYKESQPRLDDMTGDVGYLLRRVEFIRRELMFEMRYGATTPADEADRLNATTQIVAREKVANARSTGIHLNLGCGHIPLEGYLNVDRRALPGVDVIAEVDALPFEDGDVDEIFSAHLIEHFPQEQVRRDLLPYWYRLLRPGGIFRAVVPDAQAMMGDYFSGQYPFDQLREVTFGGQDYDGDFHYNMLNADSLTKLLMEGGFIDIRVIAENRKNGICKEFEIMAQRPGTRP